MQNAYSGHFEGPISRDFELFRRQKQLYRMGFWPFSPRLRIVAFLAFFHHFYADYLHTDLLYGGRAFRIISDLRPLLKKKQRRVISQLYFDSQ